MNGKLDQRAKLLRIKDTVGRDVQTENLNYLINKLSVW